MPQSLYPTEPYEHGTLPAVGVLVTNLGSPEAPTAEALKPYLKEFLSDPRVIELPRWQWLPLLNVVILNRRPAASAELYKRIWTDEGSPLLVITRQIAAGLARRLETAVGEPLHVEVGMRYGEPSIGGALRRLRDRGCRRILVLPLYPQYSATTTATTFDAVAAELVEWRFVPETRTVHGWHDESGYVHALAASLRESFAAHGKPEKVLFSFHGIPLRYFKEGDPYHCLCHKTARLTAEALELEDGEWDVSFQSLFGREEWLKPYTEEVIQAMPKAGVKSLHVICPGFSADCLETLDEIDHEYRHVWLEAGGDDEAYRYVPALNARPDHLEFLTRLCLENLGGWATPTKEWNEAEAEREAEASRRRAEAMAERGVEADGGYGA